MFSEDGDGFITSVDVLNELVATKLDDIAAQHRAAGWSWVEARPRCKYGDIASFRRITQGYREPTEKERPVLDALKATLAELEARDVDGLDDEGEHALNEALNDASDAHDQFMGKLAIWTPEQKAVAGVIVTIDTRGKAAIIPGLVRPNDAKRLQRVTANGDGTTQPEKPTHSDSLTRALTAHRTAALQAMLAERPALALVVLAHRLALQTFDQYVGQFIDNPLCINTEPSGTVLRRHAADIEGSRAWGEFSAVSAMWAAQLPADGEQLFAWLLQLPESDVLELVTFCLAASLNTQARNGNAHTGAVLASALGLNMVNW